MTKRPDCDREARCPFGCRPSIGMWAVVDREQFWGTNCVLYINCPRKNWTDDDWMVVRIAKKFESTISTPT